MMMMRDERMKVVMRKPTEHLKWRSSDERGPDGTMHARFEDIDWQTRFLVCPLPVKVRCARANTTNPP
jgi:hypothetical protein